MGVSRLCARVVVRVPFKQSPGWIMASDGREGRAFRFERVRC